MGSHAMVVCEQLSMNYSGQNLTTSYLKNTLPCDCEESAVPDEATLTLGASTGVASPPRFDCAPLRALVAPLSANAARNDRLDTF